MKARLAECEEWVVDLRTKCSHLESQYNSNLNEVEEMRNFKEEAKQENAQLQKEIDKLAQEKSTIQDQLRY